MSAILHQFLRRSTFNLRHLRPVPLRQKMSISVAAPEPMNRYILPHELFLQPLPCPPAAGHANRRRLRFGRCRVPPNLNYQLRVAPTEDETLKKAVENFSYDLRYSYPRRVIWEPQGNGFTPSSAIDYFKHYIIHPTLDVFQQLCISVHVKPIFPVVRISQANFDMITFHSDNFQEFSKWPNTPIAVLVKPELLCGIDSASTAPHSLSKILSRAWSINAHAPVICTDLQSLLVFHPPSSRSNDNMQDVLYERVEPMSDLRMIRIVIASYIYRALPHLLYITLPEHPGFNMRRFPDGAPIDPNTPMKPDEEVFSSCNRHTDFDRYALLFDRRRALQFLRWKKHVAENISPLIGMAGDVLPATTDGFIQQNAELSPLYPLFEPPSTTTSHLDAVRRPCPLGSSRELLSHSRAFTVELQRELTPLQTHGSRTRMGRTYICRLVSIDGRSIGDKTPVLCLKLFDDRFYPLTYSTDPLNYGYLENMGFGTAEDHIRREMAVYKKLAFAQGSIIPYFYGVHSVTTRDNIQVYGMLTEYIDGQPLSSGIAWSFSERQKIQLVQSARHAVRVLQYGDISLRDWHSGQILAVHSPTPSDTERVHCVLFDFSAATQSLYTQENHRGDDFGECTESLIQEGTGLDERFVMEHFGPREVWDFYVRMSPYGDCRQPDPFGFIHACQAKTTK